MRARFVGAVVVRLVLVVLGLELEEVGPLGVQAVEALGGDDAVPVSELGEEGLALSLKTSGVAVDAVGTTKAPRDRTPATAT